MKQQIIALYFLLLFSHFLFVLTFCPQKGGMAQAREYLLIIYQRVKISIASSPTPQMTTRTHNQKMPDGEYLDRQEPALALHTKRHGRYLRGTITSPIPKRNIGY